MLMSEFARASGLTPDTIRFYIRRGLLKPETSRKGGSNPYALFTAEHVQRARIIRFAQSLGFSLREIADFNKEYQAGGISTARAAQILQAQLARLEEKATQLNGLVGYLRAKVAWLEKGSKGREPSFADYAREGDDPVDVGRRSVVKRTNRLRKTG